MHEFVKDAKEQFKTLESMYDKMKKIYKEIAEYYSFDMSKKSMEEFFGDIKTFLEEYEVSSALFIPHSTNSCTAY